MTDPTEHDPVLAHRRKLGRLVKLGQRVGYLLFAVATVVFFYGLISRGFTTVTVAIITWSLIIGSVVLAPSIVLSYAVKAGDRADRDDDWR